MSLAISDARTTVPLCTSMAADSYWHTGRASSLSSGLQQTLNLNSPVPGLHTVPDAQHSSDSTLVWHMAAQ